MPASYEYIYVIESYNDPLHQKKTEFCLNYLKWYFFFNFSNQTLKWLHWTKWNQTKKLAHIYFFVGCFVLFRLSLKSLVFFLLVLLLKKKTFCFKQKKASKLKTENKKQHQNWIEMAFCFYCLGVYHPIQVYFLFCCCCSLNGFKWKENS